MKPRKKLAEAQAPEGGMMALHEHDGEYSISISGRELMHSKVSFSELKLGTLGVNRLDGKERNRVLIGGLGLGFTLKSVLGQTNKRTIVDVVELMPEMIEWNKTHLHKLNGKLLETTRVRVRNANVIATIYQATSGTYDSIMLDIDNGPVGMVSKGNDSLYSNQGVAAICKALKPNGRAILWSASTDRKFENLLKKERIPYDVVPAKLHENAKRPSHFLYVLKPEPPEEE
ncbi:spermine synthase [bacterium]|nr:spermine synthase [bacterium]